MPRIYYPNVLGALGYWLAIVAANVQGADLDGAAKAAGFNNYSHYQQARANCFGLFNRFTAQQNKAVSCGTDLQCMKSQAASLESTYQNLRQLPIWVGNKCDTVMQIEVAATKNQPRNTNSYMIEAAVNDEVFLINDQKFRAQTYCFNMNEGDQIMFLDGDPNGGCASATLFNLTTRTQCDAWCE
ncbi:MAG: hypothetical protein MN733_11985 [Nitrososphaera sp.]|nr:hypothetical protein [Nitrososphaera sp.]